MNVNVDANKVIDKLTMEIGMYAKENAILKVQNEMLQEEIEALTNNISNGGK
ncbi:hypothetical protein [Bacillus sp. UMB0728]|uniref:hypothetical protein n=1 Tax=Bacillus sp. UMB0728 TaxID=2066052 RepID=UPI0015DD9175|nr:hypothetical protein [Bacillus sp. UMB0728]